MAKTNTKEAAEALLRELPSVVGAFVSEDINGHPREIHLLIGPGPNARHLARDVRDLLEERLGVPVDQRIISIAQLAVSPADLAADTTDATAGVAAFKPTEPRLRFEAIETQAREGTVLIRVRLDHVGRQWTGEAIEIDVGMGRTRAAATAALNAATLACGQRIRFQLDAISPVRAFGRDYVLVNVLASSALIGRKPLPLAAAQPLEDDPDHAAALAGLSAINRVIGLALKD